jgi:hypothetical protein
VSEPDALALLGGQLLQEPATAALYEPAGHAAQARPPVLYSPASHPVQFRVVPTPVAA